jgi:hypothetical protein
MGHLAHDGRKRSIEAYNAIPSSQLSSRVFLKLIQIPRAFFFGFCFKNFINLPLLNHPFRFMVKRIFYPFFFLILLSCGETLEPSKTKMLTRPTWGKPEVVHNPSGFYSSTACGESYNFHRNGTYTRANDCDTRTLTGNWSWINNKREIRLETFLNGIRQRTYILTIIDLNKNLLHMKEREEEEPEDTTKFWELKYRLKS